MDYQVKIMREISIKRSEVIRKKGRINTPSFFSTQNLPVDAITQLNCILTDTLFPIDELEGDNYNENT